MYKARILSTGTNKKENNFSFSSESEDKPIDNIYHKNHTNVITQKLVNLDEDHETKELNALALLQKSPDINISKAASLEIANRIQWKTSPLPFTSFVKQECFDSDKTYYICSYGGSGSKMLQSYLSNFGNTFHIHSRNPPLKLTRVGTEDHPEWFNNIELKPILDRQLPFNQIENIKVIFIYRNPIYAIHSRIIPRATHRISTDHLDHISCDHWNIESVIGNMMDLWELEDFFDNYTIKNSKRNYSIYCVNYDKFWNNISSFNKIIDIPDIPILYPTKKETKYDLVYEEELGKIYKNMLEKIENYPPVFVV